MNTAATSQASWTPAGRRHTARAGVPRKPTNHNEAARRADRFFDHGLELAAEAFPDLWEELTESGRRHFVQEIVEAGLGPTEDRLAAIGEVIEAWYRTLELRDSPGCEEAMSSAGRSPIEVEESVHTIEELRGLLKP
jgi:hypothetical protein